MELITNLLKKVVTLNRKLESNALVMSEVKDDENEIVNFNRFNQLYDKGITAEGVKIDSYDPYAASTIKYKKKHHQPYDRVTLRDTGAFHHSFYVKMNKRSFSIQSKDKKAKLLKERYGKEIMGLTSKNVAKLRAIMKVDLLEEIENILYYDK